MEFVLYLQIVGTRNEAGENMKGKFCTDDHKKSHPRGRTVSRSRKITMLCHLLMVGKGQAKAFFFLFVFEKYLLYVFKDL